MFITRLNTRFVICVTSLTYEKSATNAKHPCEVRHNLMAHSASDLFYQSILLFPFLGALFGKFSYVLLVYRDEMTIVEPLFHGFKLLLHVIIN